MSNIRNQLIQMFMDAKYDRENPVILADKVIKLTNKNKFSLFKKK